MNTRQTTQVNVGEPETEQRFFDLWDLQELTHDLNLHVKARTERIGVSKRNKEIEINTVLSLQEEEMKNLELEFS